MHFYVPMSISFKARSLWRVQMAPIHPRRAVGLPQYEQVVVLLGSTIHTINKTLPDNRSASSVALLAVEVLTRFTAVIATAERTATTTL